MDFYKVKGCKCIENYYLLRTCQTVQESLICGTGTLPSVLQTAVCQKKGAGNRTMYQWYYENLLTISGNDNDFVNLLLVKLQVL